MTGNKANLIATLVSARAAIDALLLEVTEPVSAPVLPPLGSTSVDRETCQHGERQEMRTFGATEHWVCKLCGYEYRR